jgi:hypothetical protein
MEDHVRAVEAAITQRSAALSLDRSDTLEEQLAEQTSMAETLQKLNLLRGDVARWRKSQQTGSGTRTFSE